MKEKKINVMLKFLRVLETLYLFTFFFIIYARIFPHESLIAFTEVWIIVSYMLLPLLLFKNILVATLNNRGLSQQEKTWLLVRCILYILLTIYSYPLVANIANTSY